MRYLCKTPAKSAPFNKINEKRILFYSKEGILSTHINVCSKYVVMFIIFGAFLERTGIADFFINIVFEMEFNFFPISIEKKKII